VASRLGRLEIVKILVDAGADQSTKDEGYSNILHMALDMNPTAEQLQGFLVLLDQDLLNHLFRDRGHLKLTGQTPLHKWLSNLVDTRNYRHNYYKSTDEIIAVLKLLLKYSQGRELELLDGAGDTPLHTLVSGQRDPRIIRELLEFRPQLLYRENAVGRTPAEVANDRFMASKIVQPSNPTFYNTHGVLALVNRSPEDFAKDAEKGKTKDSVTEQIWNLCSEYLGKYPGKRRLVSLYEANDVAKRLGERQATNSRYGYRVVPSDGEDEVDGGASSVDEKAWKKKSDFVGKNWVFPPYKAWLDPEKDAIPESPVSTAL
jgi:hypothetical protein